MNNITTNCVISNCVITCAEEDCIFALAGGDEIIIAAACNVISFSRTFYCACKIISNNGNCSIILSCIYQCCSAVKRGSPCLCFTLSLALCEDQFSVIIVDTVRRSTIKGNRFSEGKFLILAVDNCQCISSIRCVTCKFKDYILIFNVIISDISITSNLNQVTVILGKAVITNGVIAF